jgi:tetratricopeptide (TPR) repeat protein
MPKIQSDSQFHLLANSEKIETFTLSAKACSILLDTKGAIHNLDNALSLAQKDSGRYIEVCNLKQMVLFLSPGQYEHAASIYNKLINTYGDHYIEMAGVYLTAMDYYSGEKSLTLLNKSLSIFSKDAGSSIYLAKALHNIGFELTRIGKYEEALEKYCKSLETFKMLSYHHQSYPLINKAVILMIQHEWNSAITLLKEALFWTKSQYPTLVIKGNMAICLYYLSDNTWRNYYDELMDYLEQGLDVDNNIYKKLLLNFAIIMLRENNHSKCADLLKKCKPHVFNERKQGTYRYISLCNKLFLENTELPVLDNDKKAYYKEIEFEPWLITFSHD